jgi:hypothetical protein
VDGSEDFEIARTWAGRIAKNNAWLHHRAAALNLRRLLALGLTHHDGAWQLT